MEVKKKIILKTVLTYVLAALFVFFVVADAIFVKKEGIAREFLPNGSAWSHILKALAFQTVSGENGTYLLYFGLIFYLSLVFFALVLVMSLIRKKFRYLINAFVALFSMILSGVNGVAFLLATNGDANFVNVRSSIAMLFFLAFLVLGFLAFFMGMVFPNGKTEKAKEVPNVAPAPVYVPKHVTETEEASEETVASEAPSKVEVKASVESSKDESISEVPEEEKPAKPAEKKAKQDKTSEEKTEPETAPVEKTVVAEQPKQEAKPRVLGKYEVFPEAGFYKFRLKANNGEILVVSQGYKSKNSATSGIETFKKNIPNGLIRFHKDKNGYAQWRLFTSNDSRMIAAGEIYSNESSARNAYDSVIKFYETDKIIVLDSIDESEIREWKLEPSAIVSKPNGKIEIYMDGTKWKGRLLASNGQVLFHTQTYSSRNSLLSGLDNIKAKAQSGLMTIAADKQGRYQFRIFAENGMLLVVGESYASKESAISAAGSVRNFLNEAKIIDSTVNDDDEE